MKIQWGFSGISTFAHLPHVKCLTAQDVEFDIGIIGVPFDTAVSYRPGELLISFRICFSSFTIES
jgi:agmatinase